MSAPDNITLTKIFINEINVSWNDIPGADTYNIYVNDNQQLSLAGDISATIITTSTQPNQKIELTTVIDGVESEKSQPSYIDMSLDIPTSIIQIQNTTILDIFWQAPYSTSYTYDVSFNGTVYESESTFIQFQLQSYNEQYIQVRSKFQGEQSEYSSVTTYQPYVPQPTNLQVSFIYPDFFITWNSVPLATSYELYINEEQPIDVFTTLTIYNVAEPGTYNIYVKAKYDELSSQPSTIVTYDVPLLPPTNVRVPYNRETNSADLAWDPANYALSYDVLITDIFGNTVTDFYFGSYIIRVRSIRGTLLSAFSEPAYLLRDIPPPTDLSAVQNLTGGIDLSFVTVPGVSTYKARIGTFTYDISGTQRTIPIVSYGDTTIYLKAVAGDLSSVEVSTALYIYYPALTFNTPVQNIPGFLSDKQAVFSWSAPPAGSITEFYINNNLRATFTSNITDTLLTVDEYGVYDFNVKYTKDGIESYPSNVQQAIFRIPAPIGLSAEKVGITDISLSWNASEYTNNYTVYINDISYNIQDTTNIIITISDFTLLTVTIVAEIANYSSLPSDPVTVDMSLPVPTISNITDVVGFQATISWSVVSGISEYIVNLNDISSQPISETSYLVTFPDYGPYSITVQSKFGTSLSARSEPIIAGQIITVPTGLSATYLGDKQIEASWTEVSDIPIVGYKLRYTRGSETVITDVSTVTTITLEVPYYGSALLAIATVITDGISQYSPDIQIDALLSQPTNFTISYNGETNIADLSWNTVYDSSYQLIYTLDGEQYTTIDLSTNVYQIDIASATVSVPFLLLFSTADGLRSEPVFGQIDLRPPAPSDYRSSYEGNYRIDLSWNEVPVAEKYYLAYFINNELLSFETTDISSTIIVPIYGNYLIYLSAVSSIGFYSDFIASYVRVPVPYPPNIQIQNIQNTQLNISWEAVQGISQYNVIINGESNIVSATSFIYDLPEGSQSKSIEVECVNTQVPVERSPAQLIVLPYPSILSFSTFYRDITTTFEQLNDISGYKLYFNDQLVATTEQTTITTTVPSYGIYNAYVRSYIGDVESNNNPPTIINVLVPPFVQEDPIRQTKNSVLISWTDLSDVSSVSILYNNQSLQIPYTQSYLLTDLSYVLLDISANGVMTDGSSTNISYKQINLTPVITQFTRTDTSGAKVDLEWTPVDFRDTYVINAISRDDSLEILTTDISATIQLPQYGTFDITVKTRLDTTDSSNSTVFRYPYLPPYIGQVVATKIDFNNMQVSWEEAGSYPTGYEVYLNNVLRVTTTTDLSASIFIDNYINYTIYVKALYDTLSSLPSTSVQLDMSLPVPTEFTVEKIGLSDISASWTAAQDISNYRVYFNNTTYDVSNGTTLYVSTPEYVSYIARVVSVYQDVESSSSNSVTIDMTIPVPTLISVEDMGNKTVEVNWSEVVDASGYRLKYNFLGEDYFATYDGSAAVIQMQQYGIYNFALQTRVTDTVYSDFSAETSITLILRPPTDVSAQFVGNRTIDISWNAPIRTTPTGYFVYVGDNSLFITYFIEGTSYRLSEQSYGTKQIVLRTLLEDNISLPSNLVTVLVGLDKPVISSAVYNPPSTIDIEIASQFGINSYDLYIDDILDKNITTLSTSITISEYKEYKIQVIAKTAELTSVISDAVIVDIRPAAPTGFDVSYNGDFSYTLKWDEVLAATAYVAIINNRAYDISGDITTTDLIIAEYGDITFTLFARIPGGITQNAQLITKTLPVPTPIGLVATRTATKQITASWTAIPNISYYNVYADEEFFRADISSAVISPSFGQKSVYVKCVYRNTLGIIYDSSSSTVIQVDMRLLPPTGLTVVSRTGVQDQIIYLDISSSPAPFTSNFNIYINSLQYNRNSAIISIPIVEYGQQSVYITSVFEEAQSISSEIVQVSVAMNPITTFVASKNDVRFINVRYAPTYLATMYRIFVGDRIIDLSANILNYDFEPLQYNVNNVSMKALSDSFETAQTLERPVDMTLPALSTISTFRVSDLSLNIVLPYISSIDGYTLFINDISYNTILNAYMFNASEYGTKSIKATYNIGTNVAPISATFDVSFNIFAPVLKGARIIDTAYLDLSWNSVPIVDGYRVYVNDILFKDVSNSTLELTEFVPDVSGLAVAVTAYAGSLESPKSNIVELVLPLPAVTNLGSILLTQNQIYTRWMPTILSKGYRLYFNNLFVDLSSNIGEYTYSTPFYGNYDIRLSNRFNTYSTDISSNSLFLQVPTPQINTLTRLSDTIFRISWQPVASIYYYSVYTSQGSFDVSSNVTQYDYQFTRYGNYLMYVTATDLNTDTGIGTTSLPSVAVVCNCSMPYPKNITIQTIVGDGTVELVWSTVELVQGYRIYYKSSIDDAVPFNIQVEQTNSTRITLDVANPYTLRISSFIANIESELSPNHYVES